MKRIKLFKVISGLCLLVAIGGNLVSCGTESSTKEMKTTETSSDSEVSIENLYNGKENNLHDKEGNKYLYSSKKDKNLYIFDKDKNSTELIAKISHKNYSITKAKLENDTVIYEEFIDMESSALDMPKDCKSGYASAVYLNEKSDSTRTNTILVENSIEVDRSLIDISGINVVTTKTTNGNQSILFMDTLNDYGFGLFEEYIKGGYIKNLIIEGNIIMITVGGVEDTTYVFDITGTTGAEKRINKLYEETGLYVAGVKDNNLYGLSKDGIVKINIENKNKEVILEKEKYNIGESKVYIANDKLIIAPIINNNELEEFSGYIDLKTKEITKFEKDYKFEEVFDDSILLSKAEGVLQNKEYKLESLK
ncbi:MAG: hypothetical protein ACRDCW_07895 [Sarcina sp.]